MWSPWQQNLSRLPFSRARDRAVVRRAAAGYGRVAEVLHWTTVLALVAQMTVGYVMGADDSGRGRGRGHSGGSGRGRGRGGDDEGYDVADRLSAWPEDLLAWHVVLGVTVLLLAVARVAWRRTHGSLKHQLVDRDRLLRRML